jgi:hypothetical protein
MDGPNCIASNAAAEKENTRTKGNVRLSGAVHMWPTPTTQEIEHPNAELTDTGRRKSKDGKSSHSLNLADQVNIWPTPIASSSQSASMDASKKEAERLHPKGQNHLAAEMASRTWPTPMVDDAKNVTPNPKRFKGSLYAEVHDSVWPTPSANEDAAGTPNGKMQRMLGNHPGIRGTTQKEFNKGALNPDWVEWLMGYAPGYTDPEYTEPMQLAEHLGFESEPDIPRVTTRKEHRVNRLKCLGNSIVPQIMYEIGKAILKDKEAEGVK